MGIDSTLWTNLEINDVHAPKTWDLTSGWVYRPCLAGGLYKKGKAVLIPSHKGLKLALEDFAESIYPNAYVLTESGHGYTNYQNLRFRSSSVRHPPSDQKQDSQQR